MEIWFKIKVNQKKPKICRLRKSFPPFSPQKTQELDWILDRQKNVFFAKYFLCSRTKYGFPLVFESLVSTD